MKAVVTHLLGIGLVVKEMRQDHTVDLTGLEDEKALKLVNDQAPLIDIESTDPILIRDPSQRVNLHQEIMRDILVCVREYEEHPKKWPLMKQEQGEEETERKSEENFEGTNTIRLL